MEKQFATYNAASAPLASPRPATSGVFGEHREAISTFQHDRGLHVSGACDEPTWLTLVEAGFSLGDRLLLLGAPQQRGDDVATLQSCAQPSRIRLRTPRRHHGTRHRAGARGLPANSGLTADGVCGVHTVRMLELVSRQSGTGPGVAVVRENESMTAHASLSTCESSWVSSVGSARSAARSLARCATPAPP